MKKSLIIGLMLLSLVCFGQGQLVLPETGTSLEALVPKNWKLLDSATGDLNQNGRPDLVFAIQKTDSSNIKANDGLGSKTIDLNPRVLAIYFGNQLGSFDQKLISHQFIIIRDEPTMDEPFEGFEISEDGVLEIKFRFWFSAGSWGMSNHKYQFRYQEGAFALITYYAMEARRNTGDMIEYDLDFTTREMKVTKGNFSEDDPESVELKDFELEKLMTLTSIKKPFEMMFEGVSL